MQRNLNQQIVITLIVATLLMIGFACNSSRQATDSVASAQLKAVDPYVGIWDYAVKDTPEGDMTGELEILSNKGNYSATMRGAGGEIGIVDFQILDNKLSGKFDYQGMRIDVNATFQGSTFAGEVGVDYTTFPITATLRNP
ncbi:MAG: hypothetical protein HKN87_03955 [Saprospiraceae bacterium]|nr:hypothetical protein [Saprospiraceae bacterium]